MKIRSVTEENRSRVYAMLSLAFPESTYEATLVQLLHENDKPIHEWVCIQSNRIIAYIAFSNAYRENGNDRSVTEVCGLHLAPIAVTPDFQNQGVGSELLTYALRQEPIKSQPLFVLGEPDYYRRFGFKPCRQPICPFDKNNAHFLSLRNETNDSFTIGYEAEFKKAERVPKAMKKPKPSEPEKLSSNKSTKGKGSSKRHYSDYNSNKS